MANKFKLSSYKKSLHLIAYAVVLGAAVTSTYYFYSQYAKTQRLLKNPQAVEQEETQAVLKEIGNIMELPKEDPTVATVSDKKKLVQQPFFVRAENGDKVLIYTTAKKAILYRPSTHKIIEVASLNVGGEIAGVSANDSTALQTLKVAVYNGTNISGLAMNAVTTLKEKLPQLSVERGNAERKDYTKTLVIDLKGTYKKQTQEIATILSGEVVSFPAGEKKPDADVLVIVAK